MSTAPCPIEAPSYYLMITHSIAAVSAPVNTLALYLILFKSQGMPTYKYCIFYLQVATILTELQMTVVCPGYYFFPMLGGYNLNSFFGKFLKSHHFMTIYTFRLASELPSIIFCFVYRHNSAVDMKSGAGAHRRKRTWKTLFVVSVQLFPVATSFCMYMSEISKEEALAYLEENYPQCIPWLQNEMFMVYDFHINPWVAVTGIGALVCVAFFAGIGFSLGFHTMIILHSLKSQMSAQTYRMQKAALLSLALQVVIPSFLLIVPLIICFVVVFLQLIEHQEFATNSTVLISCHSICSSIVMIASNSKHRKFVMKKLGWRKTSVFARTQVEPSASIRTGIV